MATSDIERPRRIRLSLRCAADRASAWNRFWRLVSYYMPKGLYSRSLIIVITPMILLQSVVTLVFMERHWQTVTLRLSAAVTRDIAAIVDMIETYPPGDNYADVIRIAQERLSLKIDILPPEPLPPPGPKPFFSIVDQSLTEGDHAPDQPAVLDRHGRQFQASSRSASSSKARCCASSCGATRPMPRTRTSSSSGWSARRWCSC